MKDALVPDILGKTPCAGDERESAVTSCIADERVPCIMDIGSAETYLQRFVKSMKDTTWKSLSNEHLSRIWAVSVAVVKSSHEHETLGQALRIMRICIQRRIVDIILDGSVQHDLSCLACTVPAVLSRLPDAIAVHAEACALLAAAANYGAKATGLDIKTSASLALQAAETALQNPSRSDVPSMRLASWSLTRLMQPLLIGKDVLAPQQLDTMATRAALAALRLMSAACSKDDPRVAHCLDLVAALVLPLPSMLQDSIKPAVRALASPAVADLICDVAASALEVSAQASALRALWYLLAYGNVTWPDSPSINASRQKVLAILTATSSAKDTPAKLAAAVSVFGNACLVNLARQQSLATYPAPVGVATLSQALPVLPNVLPSAIDAAFFVTEDPDVTRTPDLWARNVPSEALQSILLAVLAAPDAIAAIEFQDHDGFNLLHRLAAGGHAELLSSLLLAVGDKVDVLSRNRDGATALQLARLGSHQECMSLLDDVTQRAFEMRQAALLRELEEAGEEEGGAAAMARKGRKKKIIDRSASFATEEPEGKTPRLQGEGVPSPMSEQAAATAARIEREQERQREDDEYERALEARRRELEAQRDVATQQAQAAVEELRQLSSVAADGPARDEEDSSSAERPSTPIGTLEHFIAANGAEAHPGVDSDSASGSGSGDASGHGSVAAGVPAVHVCTDNDASNMLLSAFDTPEVEFESDRSSPGHVLQPSSNHGFTEAPPRQHSLFGSSSIAEELFATSQGGLSRSNPPLVDASLSDRLGSLPLYRSHSVQDTGRETSALGKLSLPAVSTSFPPACAPLQDALFVQSPLLPGSLSMAPAQRSFDPVPDVPPITFSTAFGSGSEDVRVVPQSFELSRHLSAPMPPSSPRAASSDDESLEPTRHLWIGNLCPRAARAVLKTVFERFGTVDDVVTFPGRMYAFVNYRVVEEAEAAVVALQDRVVPELTRDRALLLKYRPVKKAAMHLRALGLADGEDLDFNAGIGCRLKCDLDRDGNSSEPSLRLWLGNIAPTATAKSLQAVLGRFGPLSDAAVFPARIGPLGYAFVKFENLLDAVRAYETLNNTVVPALSGTKQLKMRYKPGDGPAGRDETADASKATVPPSRHMWLGNITQKPTEEAIFAAFSRYGRIDSVRVFPAKAYAFVNFADVSSAAQAMTELDGVPIPSLTGVKPLVMRFQQESHGTTTPVTTTTRIGDGLNRVRSESALALAASLNQLVSGGLSALAAAASAGSSGGHPVCRTDSLSEEAAVSNWNGMQRSQSVGLLGGPLVSGIDMTSYTTLLQGLQPSIPPVSAPAPAPMGTFTSSTQLSAVLSNLTALQRAASAGLPPASTPANVQHQLLQLSLLAQQQEAQSMPQQLGAESDIARLSAMLSSQSLTPAPANAQGAADPEALICPLSGALMADPVTAADGITYNRPAILEWLSLRSVSPITHAPLPHATLTPNVAIKNAVMLYLRNKIAQQS